MVISQQIREYLETIADPTLREVLTAVLMKDAAPAALVAAPQALKASADAAAPQVSDGDAVLKTSADAAAPQVSDDVLDDKKPTLLDLMVKGKGNTYISLDITTFDLLTPAPPLATLIPNFTTLGAADIAKYNALYEEAVAGGRRMLNYDDDELVGKMVKSIMSTGLIATGSELALVAAALVDMNATRTTPVVAINLQVNTNSVYFSPCQTDLDGTNTQQRTKMLTDAVIEKATTALAVRLTESWYRFDSYRQCLDVHPLGSEKMFRFIVSDLFVVSFIPRRTAEGRAKFVQLATLVMPALAPLLTDDVVKHVFDKYGSVEIGPKRCRSLLKIISDAEFEYDATPLNADIDSRLIDTRGDE